MVAGFTVASARSVPRSLRTLTASEPGSVMRMEAGALGAPTASAARKVGSSRVMFASADRSAGSKPPVVRGASETLASIVCAPASVSRAISMGADAAFAGSVARESVIATLAAWPTARVRTSSRLIGVTPASGWAGKATGSRRAKATGRSRTRTEPLGASRRLPRSSKGVNALARVISPVIRPVVVTPARRWKTEPSRVMTGSAPGARRVVRSNWRIVPA